MKIILLIAHLIAVAAGTGIVEEAGGGILGRFRVGKRCAVLNAKGGNWAEQVLVPAKQVVPVSDSIPDEQAASFFVNPATALVMIHWVLRVPAADDAAFAGLARELAA